MIDPNELLEAEGYNSESTPRLPGPKASAEVQARLWLEHPTTLLESSCEAHGDFFALDLGAFGLLAIVASPEGVRRAFALPSDHYECRSFNESYRYAMGDHALFLQDGEAHRRLKRMLAPHFRNAALTGHETTIAEETRAVLLRLGEGGDARLRPLTHEIALRCLLRLVLGDGQQPNNSVVELFHENIWRDLRSWKPWTNLSRLRRQLVPLLTEELAARRTEPGRQADLLSRLAEARDDEGAGLSDEEIVDQIMMLTVTAGDAVAVAASWTLDNLARYGEVQTRIRETAAGESGGAYLDAVCKEVLRLHPVLPTVSGRRLNRPLTFAGGLTLPAGVTLAPCQYLVHRRADVFEDPLAFRPQRFLARTYAPHEYFPFGGKERACLGGTLAPMTIRSVMAAAVSLFRLEPLSADAPPFVRHGTLLAPHEDHAVRFCPLSTAETHNG